jgi:hypothetical protein
MDPAIQEAIGTMNLKWARCHSAEERVEWETVETWDREVLEDGHIRDCILNHVQQCVRCWSEKGSLRNPRTWNSEQQARQGQNLRGNLLILNIIIFLSLFLCARLSNCNDFEQVFVYECPLSSKYKCNCPDKLRVSWGPKQVVMQKAKMHTAESHAVDNWKFLKHQQRSTVAVAVKASPLSTPVEVHRHLKNSSPQKQIDAQRLSSVRRAVRTERTNMTSRSDSHFARCR